MQGFNLELISTIIAGALSAFLGILILLHNRQGVTNKIFIIHSFLGLCWSVINYFSVVAPPDQAIWWIRLVLFCAAPHVFLFFLFVKNYPHKNLNFSKPSFALVLLIMAALMALTLSDKVFSSTKIVDSQITPVPGALMPVFGLSLIIFFLLTVGLVINKYYRSEARVKKQWLAIGSGMLASYTLLIFFVFLRVIIANDTTFVPYSALFILPIFIGAAYAILKHHLFNIKIIATEVLTFVLLLASFGEVVFATSTLSLVVAISITVFILISSTLLIKGVLREVKQREELQTLTARLEKANTKLKTLDQARAEFISIASHQLRTPPATIKWYLGAVLSGDYGELKPSVKEVLAKTERTNNLLISLVEDLLNVSRIERGKLEFYFESVDMEELARITVEQLQPLAREKGLELVYKAPLKKLPKIMADKEKLRQVMNNLIDNAIKYTKHGCIIVGLNLTPQEEIRLQVTDTGKGVAPDQVEQIFQKFTRGKLQATHSTGLGLGLYVAKVIVEQHHGKIWAESPGEGKGSTFISTLPVHNGLQSTSIYDFASSEQALKSEAIISAGPH